MGACLNPLGILAVPSLKGYPPQATPPCRVCHRSGSKMHSPTRNVQASRRGASADLPRRAIARPLSRDPSSPWLETITTPKRRHLTGFAIDPEAETMRGGGSPSIAGVMTNWFRYLRRSAPRTLCRRSDFWRPTQRGGRHGAGPGGDQTEGIRQTPLIRIPTQLSCVRTIRIS